MSPRKLLLPVIALVIVAALIGTQLAAGGTKFVVAKVAGPCVERPLPPKTDDLDQTGQTLVLLGVQYAACKLGTSRDQLLLALPSPEQRAKLLAKAGHTDTEFGDQLKAGLAASVNRLDKAKRLPAASALVKTYADQLGLPAAVVPIVKQLPANLIDGFISVGPILHDAVGRIPTDKLLADLSDTDALANDLRSAIQTSAQSIITDQLKNAIPGGIKGLLNFG